MKALGNDYNKIFEKFGKESVFDNMDRVIKLFTEAAEDNPEEGEGEEASDASGEDMPAPEEAPPADPTMVPDQSMEDEPADDGDGIYVSSNQKAMLAKAMLDALQADPPKPGEIPENLLNVTDANADEVIKYIQSLTSLSNATALEDNGDKTGLVNTLKEV